MNIFIKKKVLNDILELGKKFILIEIEWLIVGALLKSKSTNMYTSTNVHTYMEWESVKRSFDNVHFKTLKPLFEGDLKKKCQ